jgi:hypothetical protein
LRGSFAAIFAGWWRADFGGVFALYKYKRAASAIIPAFGGSAERILPVVLPDVSSRHLVRQDGGRDVVMSGGHFEEGVEDRVVGVVSCMFELAPKTLAEGFGSDTQMFGDMDLRGAEIGRGSNCALLLGSRDNPWPPAWFGFFGVFFRDFVKDFVHSFEFLFS